MITDKTFDTNERFKLNGSTFEEANMEMLVVNSDNLEEHLTMQPAALAYYGHLYKQAERNYNDLKRVYELRWKEMYADCAKQLVASGAKKTTINDVESLVYSTYKTELNELDERLRVQKMILDNLEVYYDSWKQKGFIMKSYADLVMTGYISKDHVEVKDNNVSKLHNILRSNENK